MNPTPAPSVAGTESTAGNHLAHRSDPHVPGESGVWIFILGDMTMFAVVFATYLFYRGHETSLFERSQATLVPGYGVVNTLVLVISSLMVVLGMRAMRAQQARAATWMFVSAIGCGIVFSVSKVVEWSAKVGEGFTPATNNFYMLYFVLTGLHFFHLIVGIGVLAFLARTARLSTLSQSRFAAAEGGACYWHMVDLLWIVVFPLLYLVH